MKNIKTIFALNLKKYRKINNLSQEQLAFSCGLHRTYISAIECEKRNISIENIAKIAESLNIQPYKLLEEEDIND